MCKDGCKIGLFYDERKRLITFEELKDEGIRSYYDLNNGFKLKVIHVSDYLDRRKRYMSHFNYCPYCGEKIYWEKMRKSAKESE